MQSFAPQPLSNCHYCAKQFDVAQRYPYLICNYNHQICQQCLNSLKNPASCKVCRLPIDFSKIKPNKELVQMLASSKTISYPQQPQKVVNPQNNQFSTLKGSTNNKDSKFGADSINNDINEVNDKVQNYHENIPEKNSHERGCICYYCTNYQMIEGKSNLEFLWRLPAQKSFWYIPQYLFLIQLPMSIINFMIAASAQPSKCMDKKLMNMQINLRVQYVYTFYFDFLLLIGMLLGFLLFSCRCIRHNCFDFIISLLLMLSMFKFFLWAAFQVDSFITQLAQVCDGGLYAYELLTTIIHVPIIVVFAIIGLIASKGHI